MAKLNAAVKALVNASTKGEEKAVADVMAQIDGLATKSTVSLDVMPVPVEPESEGMADETEFTNQDNPVAGKKPDCDKQFIFTSTGLPPVPPNASEEEKERYEKDAQKKEQQEARDREQAVSKYEKACGTI